MAPDRFYRFHLAAQWVHSVAQYLKHKPLILDAGSHESALADFLPDCIITSLDITPPLSPSPPAISPSPPAISPSPPPVPRFTHASCTALPFTHRQFPITVCLDVLEHITPTQRSLAVSEILRVSNDAAIIAFPHISAASSTYEQLLSHIHFAVHGTPCDYLEEHARFGLVDPESVESMMLQVFPHVYRQTSMAIDTWFTSHLIDYSLALIPHAGPIRNCLFTFINRMIDTPESPSPAYRTFLIGSRHPLTVPPPSTHSPPPPLMPGLPDAFQTARNTLDSLTHYARKLENDLSAQKTQYTSLETHSTTLQSEYNAQHRHITHLLARINELNTTVHTLTETIESLTETNTILTRDRDYLLTVRDDMEKKVQAIEALESYVHRLEAVCLEKDRSILHLQEKLAEALISLALRDKP